VLYVPDGKLTGIPVKAKQAFQELLSASPVPFVFLDRFNERSPWPSYRAVRFAPKGRITESTQEWDDGSERLGDYVMGVFAWPPGAGYAPGPRVAVADGTASFYGTLQRPTIVAHEMFHLLGLGHADSPAAGCGGGGGGFLDPRGRMASVGIDTTLGSGGPGPEAPPYRVIGDVASFPAYDLMSYCGGEPQLWISARNWSRLLGAAPPPGTHRPALPARAADGPESITVRARVAGAQAQITSLRFGPAPPAAAPAASPYALVARDAAGAVLASAPMAVRELEGARGAPPLRQITGSVAAPTASRVEITASGAVIGARSRSAHAPTGRFLEPGRGGRVGRGASVLVRWAAADADGDPVEVEIDASADGGRTFRNVAGGSGLSRLALPRSLLAPSSRARLRLRISDGFNVTQVLSAPFAVVARPPEVTILDPAARARVQAGAAVFLRGGALDAAGRRVPGRRLRWLAGRRLLGRGEAVSAVLPSWARRVRLEAVDGAGRVGSASVPVIVRSATPFFLRLEVPRRISRAARGFTLTVASTQDGVLRAGRQRFRVSPRARRVRIRIRPGRASATVHLVLTAGAGRSDQYLVVRRR
jgi:hypothetical protein